MALKYFVRNSAGTIVEIGGGGRVRTGSLEVTENAEEGAVAMSTIEFDDPDMDMDDPGGHRIFKVYDTAATGEFVYIGYTADRRVVRNEEGLGRRWLVNVVDINSILARRLLTASTANRSAETDVARVTWVESAPEGSLIDDTTYLLADDPVSMDAADYRQQYVFDVLRDAAEHSGKNFYVTHFLTGDGSSGEGGTFSLWYGPQSADDYASTARLTNVAADVSSTTFIVVSAEENIDPARVYSDGSLAYKSSYVNGYRADTHAAFARRGAVMPAVNVSTKAKAIARLARYLHDASTEDHRITAVFRVNRADVHLIRPGMLVDCKFVHLPSCADEYTPMRVLNRRLTEPNLRQYEVTVELDPPTPTAAVCTPTPTGSFYPLGGSGVVPNESDGNVLYLRPGINWPEIVSPDHVGSWHFPEYGAGGSATVDYAGDCSQNRVRCLVEGEGTIEVFTATYSASARSLKAWLMHADASAPDGYVIDETQTGDTGDTFTFTVSTHGGVNCTHWVEVTDVGDTCGGKWGFSGFDWTAA